MIFLSNLRENPLKLTVDELRSSISVLLGLVLQEFAYLQQKKEEASFGKLSGMNHELRKLVVYGFKSP